MRLPLARVTFRLHLKPFCKHFEIRKRTSIAGSHCMEDIKKQRQVIYSKDSRALQTGNWEDLEAALLAWCT